MNKNFELLLSTLGDPVTVIDENYIYRYVNQAYLESQGQPAANILGKHIKELVDAERFEQIRPYLDAAFAGETSNHTFNSKSEGEFPQFLEVVHRRFRDTDEDAWLVFSITHDCTAKIIAEQNIQIFEQVVSSSSDMICVVNEQYEYVMANRRYLEVVEKALDEVIGVSVGEVMKNEAFDNIFKPALDAAFRGEAVRTQITRDWVETGPREIDILYYRFPHPDGKGKCIACIGRDITELKRTEAAMQEARHQQQLLAEVLSSSSDAICVVKEDYEVVVANKPAIELMIGNPQVVIGRKFNNLINADAFQRLHKPAIDAAFGGKSAHIHFERTWTETGPRFIDILFEKMVSPGGKANYVVMIGRNISEIKLAELQLQESEMELRKRQLLFERAEELGKLGHWEWDEVEHRLTSCSNQYAMIYGMSVEEILDAASNYERDMSLVHPEDREYRRQVDKKILADGLPEAFEYRIITRQGDVRHIRQLTEIVKDDNNNVIRSFGTLQDITEKKEIELELLKHRDQLEHLVDERTAELRAAQAELIRQERLAALGTIMASVSHELRNPLGTVNSSVYLLRERLQKAGGDYNRVLDRIDRNVDRCNRIISELLDYTRDPITDFVTEDIDKWIEESLADMNIPEEVEVSVNLGAGLMLEFEPERLHQCLQNIIKNACDALAEVETDKTRRLEIISQSLDEHVKISISDNGPGIEKDKLENIFDPFFSTRNFGTGLGLAIVKKIIEQHDGEIRVESSKEGGSKFDLWLPIIHRQQKQKYLIT